MNAERKALLLVLFVCLVLAIGTLHLDRLNRENKQKIDDLTAEIEAQVFQLEATRQLIDEIRRLRAENEELHSRMQEWLDTWEVEPFEATAYTLEYGNGDGFTATMTRPEAGRTVAVDPEVVPLGSQVYIGGLGWRKAEDTGGLINGHSIDLYMGNGPEALRQAEWWGRRDTVVIYPAGGNK